MPVIKFPDRQIFNDPVYFENALRESGRHHVFEVVAFIDRARRMQAAFIEAPYFPIEFPALLSVSYSLPQVIIGGFSELKAYLYDTFFSEMAPLQINLPDEEQMLTQMMPTPENISKRPSEMEVPELELDFREDEFVDVGMSSDEEAGQQSRVKGMVIRPTLPGAQPSLAEASSARPAGAQDSPPLLAQPVLSPEVRSFSLGEIAEGQSITDGQPDGETLVQAAPAALGLDLHGASLTDTSLPLSTDSRAAHVAGSASITGLTATFESGKASGARLSLDPHAHTVSLTESPPFLSSVASIGRGVSLDSSLADNSSQLAASVGRVHVPSLSLTGITEEEPEGAELSQARLRLDPEGRSLSSMAVEVSPSLPARRRGMSLDDRFSALAGVAENLSADEKPYQPTQPLDYALEKLAEAGHESSPSLSAGMPKLSLANVSSVSVTSVVVAKPFRAVMSVEELADFMTAALKHLTLPYQLKSTRRRATSSTLFADQAVEEEVAEATAPTPSVPDEGCCCGVL
ncbi:hypothetical protein [Piscirickettsia salmonis]|uniref:hypothetical protein n=1 Tax=Piscirickettsia salmonis TaxID=1238 RepID=UPI0007C8A1E5|nr:hypothetical protein A0O36_01017 [Piscirickettsiaceae bacterium NZ-RLO1]